MTIRAYSYIRFSTPEQAKGSSLERQLEASMKYAEAHGLLLDDKLVYRDLGVSGYDQSNLAAGGALARFLDLVRAGDVPRGSYLLIESLDRLSRATISVAMRLLLELLERGVIVVTLIDGQRYEQTNTASDFSQLLISLTIFFRANDESATKADRGRKAWIKKREKASQVRLTKQCPAWMRLSDDRRSYELIPEKVVVVRDIVRMTMDGLGRASIARQMNERGVLTIAEKRSRRDESKPDKTNPDQLWHSSYIAKMLENRALVGEFQPHRVEKVPGRPGKGRRVPDGPPVPSYFPALLTEDDYALLQSEIKGRGTTSGGRRGIGFSNLFTGLVKCGYCGRPMVYINKGEDQRGNRDTRRNKFLLCSTAHRGKGCHKVPWIYHEFEESFFRLATRTDFTEFVSRSNDRADAIRSLREQQAIVAEKLAQNATAQARLLDALETAAVGATEAINNRLEQRRSEAGALAMEDGQLRAAVEAHERHDRTGAEAVAALDQVRAQLASQSGATAFALRARVNQTLRRMVDRISLYPGGAISSDEEHAKASELLLKSGHNASAVETALRTQFSTKPAPSHRFFSISNRDQVFQVLHPAEEVPDFENALRSTVAAGRVSGVFRIENALRDGTQERHQRMLPGSFRQAQKVDP